jgi:proteasome lid subunit RPN8/RPN11
MRLSVPRAVLDAVGAHARRALPDECCGLLVGAAGRVHRAVEARNLRASPTRYLVDPEAHFAALREARRDGLLVLGAYHSHPGAPPVPSATDLREAHDIGFLYLIVSPGRAGVPDEVRAWRAAGGRFDPVELRIDPA